MLLKITILQLFLIHISYSAFRYESRTIKCSPTTKKCELSTQNSQFHEIRCKTNVTESGKTRLACPIDCAKSNEVHVLEKIPNTNRNCTKFYTYGKNTDEDEWLIWMIDPCITTISTHCGIPE